jgi:hypothetical protein
MAKIGETKINMHSNQIQYLNKAIQRSETDTIVNKAIQSSETGTTKKVNPILFKGSDTIVNKAIQRSEIGTTKKVNHILFKGSQASYRVLQPLPHKPEQFIKDEHVRKTGPRSNKIKQVHKQNTKDT